MPQSNRTRKEDYGTTLRNRGGIRLPPLASHHRPNIFVVSPTSAVLRYESPTYWKTACVMVKSSVVMLTLIEQNNKDDDYDDDDYDDDDYDDDGGSHQLDG